MHTRFGYDRDGDEESAPIYHSAYDTYARYPCFADPGMVYLQALARLNGHLLLRVADADLLPWRYAELADGATPSWPTRLDGYVDAIGHDNDKHQAPTASICWNWMPSAWPPTRTRASAIHRRCRRAWPVSPGATSRRGSTPGSRSRWVPGMPQTVHGVASLREVELLVQSGLTHSQALASVTRISAEVSGPGEDHGSLAKGRRTNLILADGAPWRDVADLRKRSQT